MIMLRSTHERRLAALKAAHAAQLESCQRASKTKLLDLIKELKTRLEHYERLHG